MLSNKLRNKKIQLFLLLLALTGKALSTSDKPVIIPNATTNIEELLSTDKTKSIPKDMALEICKYLPGDNKFVNEMVRVYPTNNDTYKNIAKKFIEKVIDIETEENIDRLLDEHFKTSKIDIKPKIKEEILEALPEYFHLLIEKKGFLSHRNPDKTTEIKSIYNKIDQDLKNNYKPYNDIINFKNSSKEEIEKAMLCLKSKLEYDIKTYELLDKAVNRNGFIGLFFIYRSKAIELKKDIDIINNYLNQA